MSPAMINRSEKIDQLAAALSQVQSRITGARKSGVNPHFRAKYADLEDAWEAIREPMAENGLSVFQGCVQMQDGRQGLSTLLMHTSGQWAEGVQALACKDPTDPQKLGSAITYMRRYGLKAAVGLYDTDDDGNDASRTYGGQQPRQQEPQPEGALSDEVMDNYMARISACEDVNVLRGIVSSGIDEAKNTDDREAAARIRNAGAARAKELLTSKETITEDGEAVS